jgi:hypothetical protein
MHKLVLSSTFFGLGQFGSESHFFSFFLYIVPLISLVHDAYILAEDFKVKRIGFFLRKLDTEYPKSVCPEEVYWESDWLPDHRDSRAMLASLSYTFIISIFAFIAVFATGIDRTNVAQCVLYAVWVLMCLLSIVGVFLFARSTYAQYKRIGDELN